MTTLRQRAGEAHFPEDLLRRVLALPPGDPGLDRALDRVGPGHGNDVLASRVQALLDEAERTGELPAAPLEAWQEQERDDPESTENQMARAKALQEQQRAWVAEQAAEDLARRQEREAKLRAQSAQRVEDAIELRRLREEAGFSLAMMGAFLGNVDPGLLGRAEKGIPVGGGHARLLAGYRAAAQLAAPKAVP